jgi:hypothetical protein
MSLEQYTVSSILSNLRLIQWRFEIPSPYTQSNMVSLSCIAFSVEEARKEIVSMLTHFENTKEEKNMLEKEKNQRVKYSSGTDYIDREFNYYTKIKQMYQCNITYGMGSRDSSIDPRDYTRDLKVIDGNTNTFNKTLIRLEDLIKTVEPTVNRANLISFNVSY